MTPLVPIVVGVVLVAAGFLVLRSFGPPFRVGRLLATTPRVSVEQARGMAERGDRRYVRIDGRIDSDRDFEDADHRPLVLRRTRIEARATGRWRSVDEFRQQVPFEIREGSSAIAVDGDALDVGLVVVPRLSMGVAGDVPDLVPRGMAAATPVRAWIEQVSSVEHAVALGVPSRSNGGPPRLTAGLGRPLVLATVEPSAAMRLLAGGRTSRVRAAAVLLGMGALLIAVGLAWAIAAAVAAPAAALAATPMPSAGAGGDPRSSGEGPGLVGEPAFAIAAVVGLGLIAAALTAAYVRLTGGPRGDPPRR